MNDDVILNDVSPSVDLVRRWGYDDNLYFIEQDEDLVLHDEQYVPVLLELAADESCGKSQYAIGILSYFTQLAFLYRQRGVIASIAEHIRRSTITQTDAIRDFIEYYNEMYRRFLEPVPLSDDKTQDLARKLLNGLTCFRKFEVTGEIVDGYREFTCYTESYRAFVYINPDTGVWRQSQWNALTRVDAEQTDEREPE